MVDWKAVWEEVKSWFSNVGKELETEVGPFIQQFASEVGQAVLVAAEKACAIFMAQALSGAEKKAGAYDVIVKDLESQGITAASSLINSSIEVVVAKLKS